MSNIPYRPDIDALRALAVMGVILFHAGVPFISGGYVGVDVFFVISGFLITSMIAKEWQSGSFSFVEFWKRRARRILPAQLAVMAFVLAACAWAYFPQDMYLVSKQAISSGFFAANLFFYKESGYFSAEHINKPLLHFWFLSVEEQFYIFYPLIFYGLWKWGRISVRTGLLAITALSFITCVLIMHRNHDAAFYLLPFRAWELLLGALTALYFNPDTARKKWAGWVGIAGFFMIAGPMVVYTPDTAFPGVAALLPCMGAALVIYTASANNIVTKVLSLRAAVFVGLISYSLYLWHWPLLIIPEYLNPAGLLWWHKAALVCLTFVVSFLSWKYIEQPFRRNRDPKATVRFAIGAVCILLVICSSAFVQMKLYKRELAQIKADVKSAKANAEKDPYFKNCSLPAAGFTDKQVCMTNRESGVKPSFIVWGDSYAKASTAAFFELSKKFGRNGYIMTKSNCPPIFGIERRGESNSEACVKFNERVWDFMQRHKIKNVFMVGSWTNWYINKDLYYEDDAWMGESYGKYKNDAVAGTRKTIERFIAGGITPYFVINQAKMPFDVPHLLEVEKRMGVRESKAQMPLEKYKKQRRLVEEMLRDVPGDKIVVVDPMPLLCPDDSCVATINGKAIYSDSGHFSLFGARYAKNMLEPYFKEGFRQR